MLTDFIKEIIILYSINPKGEWGSELEFLLLMSIVSFFIKQSFVKNFKCNNVF